MILSKRHILRILVLGIFFLGLVVLKNNSFIAKTPKPEAEIFAFAPHWNLSKIKNVDWETLTTLAYFSLPILPNGSIDRESDEWRIFEGERVDELFKKAQDHDVKRVATLTQMESEEIEEFLDNPEAWQKVATDSVELIEINDLDGVNIDFEYVSRNDDLKAKFSEFIKTYSKILNENLTEDPYITVSVLASSVKSNKIYDIEVLSNETDGIFMMAYDFYYSGSEKIGPSAPLGGYNGGSGPYWYDVKTAVSDFLKEADSSKIIMGVPYYGWVYPAHTPEPKTERISWKDTSVTTPEKIDKNKLIETTPIGGWDEEAQVAWRSYWDEDGWKVVYIEDKNSLSKKYDLAVENNLGGVGIWALGYDGGDKELWALLSEKFPKK